MGLNPAAYRSELESLLPPEHRHLVLEIVDTLQWWSVGPVAGIIVVGLSIALALIALGTPGALVLGLMAGVLNFIPYLGAFVGAVPIAISASSQGRMMSSTRFIELDAAAWSNNTVRVMGWSKPPAAFDLSAVTLSVGDVTRRVPS